MSVFAKADFDAHEQVVFVSEPQAGLKAIIAIHNTSRGPALGGCRMWNYAHEDDAIADALRLSKGMTYKSALAGLPLGGGKSVIIGDARTQKTPELLQAFGRALQNLGGRYVAAEDVGTSTDDVMEMRKATGFVAGLPGVVQGGSGDPSPATAMGCFLGLKQAVKHRLGRDDLRGLKVAVQGLGHVGEYLCAHLHEAGAQLVVSDIRADLVDRMMQAFGAIPVAPEAIYDVEADVFAPCALGAILNDATLARLKAKVIAGSANNQLAEARHGNDLMKMGILYAPDYVINAGGIINVSYERATFDPATRGQGFDAEAAAAHVAKIPGTLAEIFTRSERTGLPTAIVADQLAEERFTPASAAAAVAA